MKRIFRAKKMLARLEKEGRLDEVNDEALEFMKLLDGREGDDYNWASVVRDEPFVLISGDDIPNGSAYVNIADCD